MQKTIETSLPYVEEHVYMNMEEICQNQAFQVSMETV